MKDILDNLFGDYVDAPEPEPTAPAVASEPDQDALGAAQAWIKELEQGDSKEILLIAANEIERNPAKVAGVLRTLAKHPSLYLTEKIW